MSVTTTVSSPAASSITWTSLSTALLPSKVMSKSLIHCCHNAFFSFVTYYDIIIHRISHQELDKPSDTASTSLVCLSVTTIVFSPLESFTTFAFLCDDAHKFRGGRAFVQKKKRHFFSLMYVSNSAVSSPYYIREQQQQRERKNRDFSLSLSFKEPGIVVSLFPRARLFFCCF